MDYRSIDYSHYVDQASVIRRSFRIRRKWCKRPEACTPSRTPLSRKSEKRREKERTRLKRWDPVYEHYGMTMWVDSGQALRDDNYFSGQPSRVHRPPTRTNPDLVFRKSEIPCRNITGWQTEASGQALRDDNFRWLFSSLVGANGRSPEKGSCWNLCLLHEKWNMRRIVTPHFRRRH